ncbi:MAG TPA: class I SAM-dependent methyltransferase [Vicinamibacterales bacterium]
MRPPAQQGRRRLAHGRSTPLDPAWLIERHLNADVARELAAHGHGVVVDVGCGGRPYEAFVPPDGRYVGLDLTPTLGSRPDCWARADALPVADATATLVLCTQVLEHLPNPEECVAEMARVLATGGHLVLTAPQAWNLHEAPHDYFRFTRYGLTALCARSGLEVVDVRPQGGFGALLGLSILMFVGAKTLGRDSLPAENEPRSWLANVLRWPLALHNLAFAVLDGWVGRGAGAGAFAVNHIVVARKN